MVLSEESGWILQTSEQDRRVTFGVAHNLCAKALDEYWSEELVTLGDGTCKVDAAPDMLQCCLYTWYK